MYPRVHSTWPIMFRDKLDFRNPQQRKVSKEARCLQLFSKDRFLKDDSRSCHFPGKPAMRKEDPVQWDCSFCCLSILATLFRYIFFSMLSFLSTLHRRAFVNLKGSCWWSVLWLNNSELRWFITTLFMTQDYQPCKSPSITDKWQAGPHHSYSARDQSKDRSSYQDKYLQRASLE